MSAMSEPIDRDALTGLYNHRFFRDALARELARARRHRHPLALIVFDIDDFKQINDQHGHAPGDAILAALAGRLRGLVRASDIACRIGGDEFAVILPESGLEDANQFWVRCRTNLPASRTSTQGRSASPAASASSTPTRTRPPWSAASTLPSTKPRSPAKHRSQSPTHHHPMLSNQPAGAARAGGGDATRSNDGSTGPKKANPTQTG